MNILTIVCELNINHRLFQNVDVDEYVFLTATDMHAVLTELGFNAGEAPIVWRKKYRENLAPYRLTIENLSMETMRVDGLEIWENVSEVLTNSFQVYHTWMEYKNANVLRPRVTVDNNVEIIRLPRRQGAKLQVGGVTVGEVLYDTVGKNWWCWGPDVPVSGVVVVDRETGVKLLTKGLNNFNGCQTVGNTLETLW